MSLPENPNQPSMKYKVADTVVMLAFIALMLSM